MQFSAHKHPLISIPLPLFFPPLLLTPPILTNVLLEDCRLLLCAGVAVHELVKHSDETEGEDGVILVSAVVAADVVQNENLLQGADKTTFREEREQN